MPCPQIVELRTVPVRQRIPQQHPAEGFHKRHHQAACAADPRDDGVTDISPSRRQQPVGDAHHRPADIVEHHVYAPGGQLPDAVGEFRIVVVDGFDAASMGIDPRQVFEAQLAMLTA